MSKFILKDSTFDCTGYNAIEIGLNTPKEKLPSQITIENVDFNGDLKNNAISIFGTADNAVVTIKNCTFKNVSNCLRVSNKSNATGVVFNIENCVVEKWESNTPAYGGFLICQDYTSSDTYTVNFTEGDPYVVTAMTAFNKKTPVYFYASESTKYKLNELTEGMKVSVKKWDEAAVREVASVECDTTTGVKGQNLFAPSKLTFNFINCTGPNGPMVADSLEAVCGSGTASQYMYAYGDYEGGLSSSLIAYKPERFPTVSFK